VTPAWSRWELYPSVLIGLALLGGLYVVLGGLAAPRRQVAAFGGALLVLLAALNGPLHDLSDRYLFSAHMVQHLVLTLLFPPLLLYGTPAWVIRPLLRSAALTRFGRLVTRPLVAAVSFTAPIVLWHVPVFYEAALRNHDLHVAQHIVFIVTAVVMWGPVLSPMLIAAMMIVGGTLVALHDEPHRPIWPGRRAWALNLIGVLLALYVFMADTIRALPGGIDATRAVLPTRFDWPLFIVALILMAAPMVDVGRKIHRRNLTKALEPSQG